MLESRLGWDPTLDRYLYADNELEANSILNELRQQAENTIVTALQRERPTWSDSLKPIDLNLLAARFRTPDRRNEYLVWMSIDLNSLEDLNQGRDSTLLETGLAVYDSTWKELSRRLETVPVSRSDTLHVFEDKYVVPYTVQSDQRKIYLSTHVRSHDGRQLGGYRFSLDEPPIDNRTFALSDLVLGTYIEPTTRKTPFTYHNMLIKPNIAYRFKKSGLVYIYFELYNLTLQNGQTRYEIEQTVRPQASKNLLTNLKRLLGIGTKEIQITRNQVGASSLASEYSAFDFSSLPAGKKVLVIRVKDLNSGQSAEKEVAFELVD
ncbi:MAG: hypothetical protein D6743_12155 [Calditrichaeota bacterium]|nr:MAG: hypothetical protein D6743_12155 [Calditrichota bacterium]